MSQYLARGTAEGQAVERSRRADDGVWPTVRVLYRTLSRGIAQLGSALRSGRRGRGFKSPYPDKLSWSEWAGISTFRAHHATGETDCSSSSFIDSPTESRSSSNRSAYTSRVIAVDVCPSYRWMAFTFSPLLTIKLAAVCRRSWMVIRSTRPHRTRGRTTCRRPSATPTSRIHRSSL